MLCRYCGRWYRSLGHRLRGGHGVDPDSYREQFELPATMPLMAADLRERQAERARQLLASKRSGPAAFGLDDPDNTERRQRQARGVRRKAETESRAGAQSSKHAVGGLLAQNSRARAALRASQN